MKNLKTIALSLLLLLCLLALTACGGGQWETASYDTDTELGTGAKTITVMITDDTKTVTFTIHTDKATVGAALLEHRLIAGENGAYGLYVKAANGTVADYDVDQSYWGFYIDGEMAMTGVDSTTVAEGVVYQLKREK